MSLKTYAPDLSHAINRSIGDPPVAAAEDEALFFASNKEPPYLSSLSESIKKFVKNHKNSRIALVTSGGTTVPLENNTVRFIDNFSAGTRGAISAEYLLDHDYKVIFLYRELSFMPYLRHFAIDPHHENILDFVDQASLAVKDRHQEKFTKILDAYNKNKHNLLAVPFTTVTQYLYTLKAICEILGEAYEGERSKVLIYLAAAVSDFYIPENALPRHKIQSGSGLTLDLSPVPKFLARIIDSWCPGAFVVSFKLETDKSLLYPKCTGSLQKYHQNLVIGNLLQTRQSEVMFVWFNGSDFETKTFSIKGGDCLIEAVFIPHLVKLHASNINRIS